MFNDGMAFSDVKHAVSTYSGIGIAEECKREDGKRFWTEVIDHLRETCPGQKLSITGCSTIHILTGTLSIDSVGTSQPWIPSTFASKDSWPIGMLDACILIGANEADLPIFPC